MTEQIDFAENPALDVYVPLQDGTQFNIPHELVDLYQDHYPHINVREQLDMLVMWNVSNPKRRKQRVGILRHVNQWLCKAQQEKLNGKGTSTVDRVREATGGRLF